MFYYQRLDFLHRLLPFHSSIIFFHFSSFLHFLSFSFHFFIQFFIYRFLFLSSFLFCNFSMTSTVGPTFHSIYFHLSCKDLRANKKKRGRKTTVLSFLSLSILVSFPSEVKKLISYPLSSLLTLHFKSHRLLVIH